MKKKILTVVGARPQFIKAAVVSKAITRLDLFREIIVHTGQHYDQNMSKIFFRKLNIKKPKYFLNINKLNHNVMISKMILKLDKIYKKEKPDGVIVFGDTNSSLSAALSAKKRKIPTFHIESGVRNFDEKMPEESNRYLIDRISDLNFCATDLNYRNLFKEGYCSNSINSKVIKSGDVMFDLFKEYLNNKKIKKSKDQSNLIICTIHRESNVDDINNLKNIITALDEINNVNPVLLISHPRTKKIILKKKLKYNFKIIDSISYSQMIDFLISSKFVITDSGGLIKEAFFAKKKSISILEAPVWPELVSRKCCINVPPSKKKILKAFKKVQELNGNFHNNIFGNGKASELIIKKINNFLK